MNHMVCSFFGKESWHLADRSVAGYAYCSVAALSLLDRPWSYSSEKSATRVQQGITDQPRLLKFLSGRQFTYLAEEEDQEEEDDAENYVEAPMGSLSLDETCRHVGFNGRWNKKADTCYCWWVAATLQVRQLSYLLWSNEILLF